MKILIICTGTCRSQMAEGFFKAFNNKLNVFSAGTNTEEIVNPNAIKVKEEEGIDISQQFPENVEKYMNCNFDYVITFCDNSREICPAFTGKVKRYLHIGFDDPATAVGTADEILSFYRKVRDQIKDSFLKFNNNLAV